MAWFDICIPKNGDGKIGTVNNTMYTKFSPVPLWCGPIYHYIICGTMMAEAKHDLNFKLTGELWGVHCGDFEREKIHPVRRASPCISMSPDSKVHGTNMGPIWGRQEPCSQGLFYLCQLLLRASHQTHCQGDTSQDRGLGLNPWPDDLEYRGHVCVQLYIA